MREKITKELAGLQELYQQKKYQEIEKWLLDNRQEVPEDLFHFNLGTVLGKSGDLATSRYHFEKLISKGYFDTRLIHNLEVTKESLGIREQQESLMASGAQMFLGVPESYFLFLSLFFTFLLVAVVNLKKRIVLTFALLLFIWIPFGIKRNLSDSYFSVVNLQEANLYEGPSQVFSDIGVIPAGSKMIISRPSHGWCFVELPSRFRGWVKKERLGIL